MLKSGNRMLERVFGERRLEDDVWLRLGKHAVDRGEDRHVCTREVKRRPTGLSTCDADDRDVIARRESAGNVASEAAKAGDCDAYRLQPSHQEGMVPPGRIQRG